MLILITSIFSLFAVGSFIKLAEAYGWGKAVRRDGPKSHLYKEGTPTMGGIAFLATAFVIWLIFSPKSPDMWALVLLTFAAGLLGWADDVASLKHKLAKKEGLDASTGLLARYRIIVQTLAAFAFALYAVRSGHQLFGSDWLDVIGYSFIIVGAINAVNFTDGLDGLAGGVMVICLLPMMPLSFIPPLIGSLLGFLWFNAKPARVFMGGVGSEALGAALAGSYILAGWTWLLPLAAIIPVLEVLSVMIQVSYFRSTGGKRIFKMTPIHHHFELSDWKEEQVVIRFWLVTAVAVALAWAIHLRVLGS
ncbi:MAG: phospho-N-acetylmuramoyl-pentapeptide-transferase [Deinococcales bacterium]